MDNVLKSISASRCLVELSFVTRHAGVQSMSFLSCHGMWSKVRSRYALAQGRRCHRASTVTLAGASDLRLEMVNASALPIPHVFCTTDTADTCSLIANIFRNTPRRHWMTTVCRLEKAVPKHRCGLWSSSTCKQAPTNFAHCPATSSPHAT